MVESGYLFWIQKWKLFLKKSKFECFHEYGAGFCWSGFQHGWSRLQHDGFANLFFENQIFASLWMGIAPIEFSSINRTFSYRKLIQTILWKILLLKLSQDQKFSKFKVKNFTQVCFICWSLDSIHSLLLKRIVIRSWST